MSGSERRARVLGPLVAAALVFGSAGCARIADFDDFETLTEQEYFLQRAAEALGRRVLRCEPKLGLLTAPVFELLLHPAIGADVQALYLNIVLSDTFDSALAEACLEQLGAADCSVRGGLDTGACATLFGPTVPPGGACLADANCVDGYCETVGDACGGVCLALAGEGDTCAVDADCGGSLWCNNLMCAPRSVLDGPCTQNAHCEALYWCEPGSMSCQPLPEVNQACERDVFYDDPCRQNLVCSGGTCKVGQAEDESCVFGVQPCAPGLRCAASGTCVPVVGPGEACDSSESCPFAYACITNVCVPFPSLGDECDPTRECLAGACVGGVCEMLPMGATCNGFNLRLDSFGDQCEGWCDTSGMTDVCADAIPDGAACADDFQCLDGSECVDGGAGLVCTPCGG